MSDLAGFLGNVGIFSLLSPEEAAQVRDLRPSLPTLEDVFAQAVGEE